MLTTASSLATHSILVRYDVPVGNSEMITQKCATVRLILEHVLFANSNYNDQVKNEIGRKCSTNDDEEE
jgi:hypothetical protein